ncbi:MAG: hypothetical protein ACI9BW_001783 [Gammaproteobacteria bacterium]|jgi:hypothetical protein
MPVATLHLAKDLKSSLFGVEAPRKRSVLQDMNQNLTINYWNLGSGVRYFPSLTHARVIYGSRDIYVTTDGCGPVALALSSCPGLNY